MKKIILLFSLTLASLSYSFSPPTAFNEGYLKVSDLHDIWYAEYGNPEGKPVVVLHGGPGAGCSVLDTDYFDLKFWRVILLDQRGAKRSKPFGEIKENNTEVLISDLEKLRHHLNLEKWLVFGGSWGSTLALAYGESQPKHVAGFILRGVFLGRKQETQQLWYGMKDSFPDAWQEFNSFIPVEHQNDLITAYYNRLMNPDYNIAIAAAKAFMKYDLTCAYLKVNQQNLNKSLNDEKLILGVARLFAYYSVNNFFLKENQLLANLNRIKHLPAIIVHGRYDLITRARTAYELHQSWPNSELILVDAAGHSAKENNIKNELIKATEKMKSTALF